MQKGLLVVAIGIALGVLIFLGIKDIRKFGTEPGSSYSPPTSATDKTSNEEEAPASDEKAPSVIQFVKDPRPAPEFTLKEINGGTINSADYHGKVILVNFWATWCPPCRAELPDLIALQDKYKDKLQIIGLSDDTGPIDDVKTFVKEHKINYPIALATPELESKFGGVMGLPTSFLVNTDGKVMQKHIGLRNPKLYDTEIRALLNLPVQAKVETFTDKGQVFLSNAKNATELPGVDFTGLSPEQRKAALREMNEKSCDCGCAMTIAQCRVNDTSCETSAKLAAEIVKKVKGKS